ncbi:MAG: ABC transporter substrate-binding protein, partial [Acetobacteraceae bacterium]
MIGRRAAIAGGLAAGATLAARARADKATVKIGNTMPYSGVASSYAPIGWTDAAFFKMLNEQGGVGGPQIEFISLDDAASPPRTVEDVRRMVEQDRVDFLFNTLGTPSNTAIEPYCDHNKIPQLFVATGADKWGDYQKYPWTIGFQPSYRTEAQIYAKYTLRTKPAAKIAIMYQNDDFGKDYVAGVRDVLGKDWDRHVVKTASYEVTDPTVDSQVESLQASGADALIAGASPKAAVQTIRRVHSLGWQPLFFLSNVSLSVASVMRPAGAQSGIDIISSGWLKDPTDPDFKNDPGMNEWRAFMARYMP